MIEIKYTKKAGKSLNSLERITKNRIIQGINNLPLGDIKHLQGYNGMYRLRVGDFRVIFSMDTEEDIIIIRDILPRGEAYKRY